MCTSVRLQAKNNAVVYARTLEFGIDIQSQIVMIPRNYQFVGTTGNIAEGLRWKSRYAVIGANASNVIGVVDGVNEQGLAGGLFYFPGYATFQQVSADEYDHSIAPWELLTWLLTSYATVAEVKQALPTIRVAHIKFGPWGIVPPVHVVIHDTTGNCLVIEYINGNLVLHDNPLGVITNSPSFDWHITNLSNYINLSPNNVPAQQHAGITISALGQGSGMLGLPGDFTSPSRFVRAAVLSQSVVVIDNEHDARDAAFHILNMFNIPRGFVRQPTAKGTEYELTQWTSACDLSNKSYYWHTYNNRQVHKACLLEFDLDASQPHILPMQYPPHISDITPR